MKTLAAFIILIFSSGLSAQSITAVLGNNGVFTVKNSSNYFTISRSTGQVNILGSLRLGSTTGSGQGVLYFGANRFMHIYGSGNTFLGENAGNFTLQAPWNTGIGFGALQSLSGVTGTGNTAFGNVTLNKNTTGADNTAFGYSSLFANTTGVGNSAFGSSALMGTNTGEYNSAFGYNAFSSFSNTDSNSAFGCFSLYFNTTGYQNSALGFYSLYNNGTGFNNTALGLNAGSVITTGNNLTCLGYNSQPTSGSAQNQITLGNSSVTVLRSTVTTIASLSDARDKKNIRNLTLGIDLIAKLKPRLYNWDKREWYPDGISDGSKRREIPTAGFIAQELDEVQCSENTEWLNLVLKDNPKKLEATPDNLLPVIVYALQQLKSEQEKNAASTEDFLCRDKELMERIEKLAQSLKSPISGSEKLVNEVQEDK
jgi:hypothetical protein